MDALTFAEWQREQDDEAWARFAPLAEDGPHLGGCGCAVSQIFGGDCAHTLAGEFDDEEEPATEPAHVHEPCTEIHGTGSPIGPGADRYGQRWNEPHCAECGELLEETK